MRDIRGQLFWESAQGFDAILLIPEIFSVAPPAFEITSSFTKDKKIPIGGSWMITDDYETIFTVKINTDEMSKPGARLADKVLRGIPADTIPVVLPESYLKINYKITEELD